jgi:hypothetical protein
VLFVNKWHKLERNEDLPRLDETFVRVVNVNETEVNTVSYLVLHVVGVVVSVATSGVWRRHCTWREGIRGGGRAPLDPKLVA